jgi:hypothetical protein
LKSWALILAPQADLTCFVVFGAFLGGGPLRNRQTLLFVCVTNWKGRCNARGMSNASAASARRIRSTATRRGVPGCWIRKICPLPEAFWNAALLQLDWNDKRKRPVLTV